LGLTNTATRLIHLYGENHEFESGPREEGGYAVRITIPFRLGRLAPARTGVPVDASLSAVIQS